MAAGDGAGGFQRARGSRQAARAVSGWALAYLAVACSRTSAAGDRGEIEDGDLDGGDQDADEQDAGDDGCSSWGPFSQPELVPSVSTLGDDWEPAISGDGRSLVFSSWRPGGLGKGDFWLASRADSSSEFAPAMHLASVSSTDAEETPNLSADGLTLYFSSSRPGGGGFGVWYATRPDRGSPFSAPANLRPLGTAWGERSPWISADGLRLYLISWNGSSTGGADVFVASRPTKTSSFSRGIEIAEVSSPDVETNVSLSADELEMYITTDRPQGKGGLDIWVARRPDDGAAFSRPVPVTELNSPEDDVGPSLSLDGTTVYFNYNAYTDGTVDADIWFATRACVE